MNTSGAQNGRDKLAAPANDPLEALTVPPQDRPAAPTPGNGKGSTSSPGGAAADGTDAGSGATGPYLAAGGPDLPPMSGPADGLAPGATGAEAIPGHEVLGELGRGGMGVVYKARHLRLKRLVAVKMILAGGHAGEAELVRFRTEAEAVARLQHPNIVQIHEVGEHEGRPFFSLELCGGGSLAARLAGTPLPPAEAATLVSTLAVAMQAAHQANVIHRDLKPANVLLAEDGTPKVTDFGLAKKLDEAGQSIPGAVMGTPSYMAPEQAGGRQDIGPPADVYALGAVLYECLTGRPPFKAATSVDTILQVIGAEPVPPRRLNETVPRDLETICLKCLQKEPGKRYASAQALADDLRRFLKHEPILARPATGRERFVKWCRRNPWLAGFAAALVVYAVTATWLSVKLSKQTRIALENEKIARAGQMKAFAHVGYVAESALARHLRQPPGKDALPPEAVRRAAMDDVRKEVKALAQEMKLPSFNQVAVHQQAGDFARNIGLLREALAEYAQGYELMKGVARDEPANDMARANMAVMRLRLGNTAWEMNGDVEAARQHFEEAWQLRQEIADHPRSGDYSAQQNDVALAYIALDLGRLELSQGNLKAARESLARALEARRAWAQAPPEEDRNMAPSFLSEACMWMGVVLALQGDQAGADKLLDEALELTEGLARRYPDEPNYQVDLVDIHGARGDVQALRGDWEAASDSYLKARKHVIQGGLLQAEDMKREVILAQTLERLAAAADKKGDAQKARGHRKMSLRVREKLTRIEPACVSWQVARLLSLAHMDGQADDQAAELAKRAAGNCELLLQLARYHAVRAGKAATPAQRRAAADRALALLGDAVKAGYADRFTLAGDPDLAPLRQGAEFKALLDRLAR